MVSSIAVITVLNYEMQIFHLLNILHFDYFLSSVIHHWTSPFTERAYMYNPSCWLHASHTSQIQLPKGVVQSCAVLSYSINMAICLN